MKKARKEWTQKEMLSLPGDMELYRKGEITEAQLRAAFKWRSVAALRTRASDLKTGRAPKPFVASDVITMLSVEPVKSRPLKTIRLIENDRIVTYQELVAA
jgi:hypothetical protein